MSTQNLWTVEGWVYLTDGLSSGYVSNILNPRKIGDAYGFMFSICGISNT